MFISFALVALLPIITGVLGGPINTQGLVRRRIFNYEPDLPDTVSSLKEGEYENKTRMTDPESLTYIEPILWGRLPHHRSDSPACEENLSLEVTMKICQKKETAIVASIALGHHHGVLFHHFAQMRRRFSAAEPDERYE
ncbi:hypothetical protein CPB84DRAFT_1752109 [Gymnopilus junonius]|uniref:Uncharacterized protein n=1 Tax=Gymnopilus junonius TaxID=109634 RepID=A0A9P5NA16_GYMJU|nr:hypothetical protein CPB84DRAFT_1752109 [Gymnopilus junonius]